MRGEAGVRHCLGEQAAELGLWGVARRVFEHAIQRHPRHPLMLEKLVEVRQAACHANPIICMPPEYTCQSILLQLCCAYDQQVLVCFFEERICAP